ncbi:hypothetical protein [Helicobacter sp. T3_23-1056]
MRGNLSACHTANIQSLQALPLANRGNPHILQNLVILRAYSTKYPIK